MGHTKASQLCTQFCAKMTTCAYPINLHIFGHQEIFASLYTWQNTKRQTILHIILIYSADHCDFMSVHNPNYYIISQDTL